MTLVGKILVGVGVALVVASWAFSALALDEAATEGVERPFGAFFHALGLDRSFFTDRGVRYRHRAIVFGLAGFAAGIVGLVLWAAGA